MEFYLLQDILVGGFSPTHLKNIPVNLDHETVKVRGEHSKNV